MPYYLESHLNHMAFYTQRIMIYLHTHIQFRMKEDKEIVEKKMCPKNFNKVDTNRKFFCIHVCVCVCYSKKQHL